MVGIVWERAHITGAHIEKMQRIACRIGEPQSGGGGLLDDGDLHAAAAIAHQMTSQ